MRGRATPRSSIGDTSSPGTSPCSGSCRGASRDRSATSPLAPRGSSDFSTSTPARSLAPARTAGLSSRNSAEPRRPCCCSRSAMASTTRCSCSCSAAFVDGLSLGVNYTLGRAISPNENSSLPVGDHGVQALPYLSRNLAYTSNDRRHNLGITNVWQIPVGPDRRWLNDRSVLSYILGGWQVNNMISIMSGPPFSVLADDTSLNLPGSVQTADQVKEAQKLGGVGRSTPYYDPTAFAEVTAARFGNTGYNILRGPGLFNWDFGLTREFAMSGDFKLQVASGILQLHEHAASRAPRQQRRGRLGLHDDHERSGSRARGDRRTAVQAGRPDHVLADRRTLLLHRIFPWTTTLTTPRLADARSFRRRGSWLDRPSRRRPCRTTGSWVRTIESRWAISGSATAAASCTRWSRS